ncbi:uncharacterized protein B0J16DRAFT_191517 [Fusarium flagelliforme]|uniref:Uncharacterized protein n=1 Tax=Fusarium flagelliforme TaxID=2675880 RepID=A0A395N0R3_9HYPO|nr:uncharacterized protein B0J16DRAFT_191517 [Fusarium flagelliforme]KAH7173474.1 hypothetical protein B0J16DRAFT_191517 [Fusarium flagelliforme]RFN53744.1 hypothetical protein FIE12Z_2085 [Fusarium flagelliforme]
MAPSPEKRRLRWQTKTKTKRGFAGTVPDWTVAEDDDDKYDVHIMRRRSVRHRLRRRDISSTPVEESEVLVSILHDEPYATQPVSTPIPTPTPTKAVKAYESGSDSDSQSGDESMSDDENEESDDEEESDPVPTDQPIDDKDVPYKVKLPASATETPIVEAPSAEGSIEESMISGGEGIHSNVHKILLGVGSVGGFLLLLGIVFLVWKFHSKKKYTAKPPPPPPVDDMSHEKPNRFETLVSKLPFLGPRLGHKDWYTIEDPSPPYSSYNNDEKKRRFSPSPSPSSLPPPLPVSSLPKQSATHLTVPAKPYGLYRMSSRTEQTNYDIDATSPTSPGFVENAVQVQVVARHAPRQSQGLSPPYYKPQPQHNRAPSAAPYAYDVARRQTGVSELSSISSGFGDGDIVITPSYQTAQSMPSQPTPSRQPTWKSTNTHSRRDTVSTVASVETRPRFHSVNSWVKQQNGQLRRAQRQQEQSDAPPVPALAPPPEQDFRYMLQDDERPRPVEMV